MAPRPEDEALSQDVVPIHNKIPETAESWFHPGKTIIGVAIVAIIAVAVFFYLKKKKSQV